MQESRNFDVLFEVFLGVFLVFGREKNRRERLGRREISEKCLWGFGACLGLFIALGAKIEAVAIVGSPTLILL